MLVLGILFYLGIKTRRRRAGDEIDFYCAHPIVYVNHEWELLAHQRRIDLNAKVMRVL